jgi:Fic family protein
MSFISQFFNASMVSVKLIGQIDEFKGTWSLLGNTVTDHYLKLQRESTIETIGSSMRLAGISIDNGKINTLLTQTHPILTNLSHSKNPKMSSEKVISADEESNTLELTKQTHLPDPEKTQNKPPNSLLKDSFWPAPQSSQSDFNPASLAPINKGFFSSEENEALGYFEALELAWDLSKQKFLTLEHVLSLHQTLMSHSPKDQWHSGKYKISANGWKLQANPDLPKYFETASTADTPNRMVNLMDWLRAELGHERTHPLIICAVFMMTFLEIHPFQDGNGRMARILVKLLLWRGGYPHTKYSSLDHILESEKFDFYRALEQTLTTLQRDLPDWEAWLQYFLSAVLKDSQGFNQKLKSERKNFSPLPQLAVCILELARTQGKVTLRDALKETDGNRNTLKLHFKTLVAKGMLIKEGLGAGVWYHLS